jgi:hypothetical protein
MTLSETRSSRVYKNNWNSAMIHMLLEKTDTESSDSSLSAVSAIWIFKAPKKKLLMMRWIYEEIYAVTNDMIILQFRETFVRFLLFSMPFEKLKLSPRQQSREASYCIVYLYQIVLHNFVRFVKMVLIFVSNIMSSKTNISIHSSSVHVSYCLTEYLHTRRWNSIRTNIVCFLKYIAILARFIESGTSSISIYYNHILPHSTYCRRDIVSTHGFTSSQCRTSRILWCHSWSWRSSVVYTRS